MITVRILRQATHKKFQDAHLRHFGFQRNKTRTRNENETAYGKNTMYSVLIKCY